MGRGRNAGNKNQGSNWITKKRRALIYLRDGGCCVYCGARKPLSLDHLKPRSKGGGNESSNLVTACVHCNVERGDTPLAKFVGAARAKEIRRQAKRTLKKVLDGDCG